MKHFILTYFLLAFYTIRDVYNHTSFNIEEYLTMPDTIDFLFITFEVIVYIFITLTLIKHFVETKIIK